MILHIMDFRFWKKALHAGEYAPSSLEKDGFIHCSTPAQILDVANTIYRGCEGLFLLFIDEKKVTSPVVYEDLYESGKIFPHIYGPLNIDAVVRMAEFSPGPDGMFHMPQE